MEGGKARMGGREGSCVCVRVSRGRGGEGRSGRNVNEEQNVGDIACFFGLKFFFCF